MSTKKKKVLEAKLTGREKLMRNSLTAPTAIAQDSGRLILTEEGLIDRVVLNDLLCHLIIQNQMLMRVVFPQGPPGANRSEGGIILPS